MNKIVCPECYGEGKMVHPAVSMWTEDDRMEDPDGFDYMLSGGYDITCPCCKGVRVVEDTPDFWEQREDDKQDRRTRLMEDGLYGRDY